MTFKVRNNATNEWNHASRVIDSFSSAIACPPSRAATSAIGCASGNTGRAQARQAWSEEEKVSVSLCLSVANEKN
jgi:hypothetical protein